MVHDQVKVFVKSSIYQIFVSYHRLLTAVFTNIPILIRLTDGDPVRCGSRNKCWLFYKVVD